MSEIDICNFLPKYPNINKNEKNILNLYPNRNFYGAIFHKKEFYDQKLEENETIPQEKGSLLKNQRFIARFLSSYTPYDSILLVHKVGSGKTCASIGAIEQIRSETNYYKKALIIVPGPNLESNYRQELLFTCTDGRYIPPLYDNLTERQKTIRVKKETKFYDFKRFQTFASSLGRMGDERIKREFSKMIIVIDEVHNARVKTKGKESVNVYEQLKRFLHLVENCKIIIMSGTPMKDSPSEIADVMNLILPRNKQFEGDFTSKYMKPEKDGTLVVKDDMMGELENKFKGRVSYLDSIRSNVEINFSGDKNVGELKHFIVKISYMSDFQTKVYEEAYNADETKKGVYSNARQASLFVFPDESYGAEGYKKYIRESRRSKIKLLGSEGVEKIFYNYRFTEVIKRELKGRNNTETLKNIKKYSSKYGQTIESILKAKNQSCIVYNEFVSGSGSIVFAQLLELVGFERASGNTNTNTKKLRYSLLTNITTTPKEIFEIINTFNDSKNKNGEYIKVIIGSRLISEGLSFKNVQQEFIITPHWNYSETEQAIARGIRFRSHEDLENPVVTITQTVARPSKDKLTSIDLKMYQISEIKDINIKRITRVLQSTAVDCALNYKRNYNPKAADYTRECNYGECKYSCKGIKMDEVFSGIPENELDLSTYQLYYINRYKNDLYYRIESLFKKYGNINVDDIVEYLKGDYNRITIENSLKTWSSIDEPTFNNFRNIYTNSVVQNIANGLESFIFKKSFTTKLSTILKSFPKYNLFEVLTALKSMIEKNTIIFNKYGFPCYLKTEGDNFYLVESLNVTGTKLASYYTKYPTIKSDVNFKKIATRLFYNPDKIVNIIDRLTTASGDTFNILISSLPEEYQELLLETVVIAKLKNIDKDVINNIYSYFEAYINKIGDIWISTFREDDDIYRCYKNEKWSNCSTVDVEKLGNKKEDTLKKLLQNEFGYYGTYNSTNKDFCIVETEGQKDIDDKRKLKPGKRCNPSWNLKQLVPMALNVFKLSYPKNYLKDITRKELIEKVKSGGVCKYDSSWKDKFLLEKTDDELRRAIYWGTKKFGGKRNVKDLCGAIQSWFRNNNLLLLDPRCGVQGKTKNVSGKKKETSESAPSIIKIIPNNDKNRFFDLYQPQITKLYKECTARQDFVEKDHMDSTWYILYNKYKIFGLIVVDKNKEIVYICVKRHYRNNQEETVRQKLLNAFKTIYKDSEKVKLKLSNNSNKFQALNNLYTKLGFKKAFSTGTETVFTFKIN